MCSFLVCATVKIANGNDVVQFVDKVFPFQVEHIYGQLTTPKLTTRIRQNLEEFAYGRHVQFFHFFFHHLGSERFYTRQRPVPVSLQGMLGTVLCVARARSADGYRRLLEENGFASVRIRQVNWALTDMIQRVRHKLRTLCQIGVLKGNPGEWRDTESLLTDLDRFISDGGAGYLLAVGHRRTDQAHTKRSSNRVREEDGCRIT